VNRRVIAAALAGMPLALALGTGTAAAAQPAVAPPLSAITAPITSAPTLPGVIGWAFDDATNLVAVSCARTTTRSAWVMPLAQLDLLSGGHAGFSKTVPIIDTAAGLVEWAAYGTDPSVPLLRSGCLTSAGQRALNWGDPVISERATVRPPAAGAPLSILPGEPVTTPIYAAGPPTTAPATTAPATTAPATTAPATAAQTPAAPVYTGTPGYSAAPARAHPTPGAEPLGAPSFSGFSRCCSPPCPG